MKVKYWESDVWGSGYFFLSNFSFIRPDILEELVNLVIHEPEDDMDEKLKYKWVETIGTVIAVSFQWGVRCLQGIVSTFHSQVEKVYSPNLFKIVV